MRRGFIGMLGLAGIVTGVWLFFVQNSRNNACNASVSQPTGMGRTCGRLVFMYFGGFILVSAGLVLVVFASLLMKRRDMRSMKIKIPQGGRHKAELELFQQRKTRHQ